jgi:cobalt-zinc-cadmium efflux system membrane fusion protein
MQKVNRAAIVTFSVTVLISSAFTACSRSPQKPGEIKETSSPEKQADVAHFSESERLPTNTVIITADSPLRKKLVTDIARIFPPVTGHLMQVHVQLGDSVMQGQLLATLSSPDFTSAQSDYLKARSAVSVTERNLKRQTELLKAKIAAQAAVDQAQSDYDSAKSDLEAASNRLLTYGFNPEKDKLGQPLRLYAPVEGKVVDMATGKGEFKNDPNSPLMTIADLSKVWLAVSVQEKDLPFLKAGQQVTATFAAYPDEEFQGRVLYIGDILDPDTRATKVRIALENADGRFKPGMFATVNLKGVPEEQVTVPATALVQVGSAAFIYKQVRPDAFVPVEVKLGQQEGDRIVILQGLKAGTPILAKDGVLLLQ